MTSGFDSALQRALSVRLNLQIGLSSLATVEEWMDIHLDRFLEHVPMPPEMPDGFAVSYLAAFGSDLSRLFWGAWGDPRGFVPKMADYFKLCNMAKSDEAIIDQIGNELQPQLVGMWIGVAASKVITGWHFGDPQAWERIEPLFGTHEAKFQLKQFVEQHAIPRIERFQQSIGEAPYSELELALPGATTAQQAKLLDEAFTHFTGAPLAAPLRERIAGAAVPELAIAVRIRGGQVVKLGAMIPGIPAGELAGFCADAGVPFDERVLKLTGALSGDGGIAQVEYVRAGAFAGVDIFVEPGEPPAAGGPAPASEAAN